MLGIKSENIYKREPILKIEDFYTHLEQKFIGKPIMCENTFNMEKVNSEIIRNEINSYTKRLLHFGLINEEFEEDFNMFLSNRIEIK